MIDVHSHILPGIDDGSSSYEESIEILKEAKEAGFDEIISTSHYYLNEYTGNEKKRKELLNKLNEDENNEVRLHLGSEIYVCSSIPDLIEQKEASTMNCSKYVLFEIHLRGECPELKNVIIDLQSKGYKLILAHPERYEIFQKNPSRVEEILDLGVYLQSNFLSILGEYGKAAQKTVELFLKHDMISFLGTDVHREKRYFPRVKEASEKIIDIIGQDCFDILTNENPKLLLENKEIDNAEYTRITKTLFGYK